MILENDVQGVLLILSHAEYQTFARGIFPEEQWVVTLEFRGSKRLNAVVGALSALKHQNFINVKAFDLNFVACAVRIARNPHVCPQYLFNYRDFQHFGKNHIRVGDIRRVRINKNWTIRVISIKDKEDRKKCAPFSVSTLCTIVLLLLD